jgi:hypothetical protein
MEWPEYEDSSSESGTGLDDGATGNLGKAARRKRHHASPLGMVSPVRHTRSPPLSDSQVHDLGRFAHRSPQRMEQFRAIGAKVEPVLGGPPPLAEVVTRWDSKCIATERYPGIEKVSRVRC